MNVKNLSKPVSVSFDYSHKNGTGELRRDKINLKVKRIEFREAASKEFRAELDGLQDNPLAICERLVKMIESWDLTEDDAGQVPAPISSELLQALPMDFLNVLAENVMQTMLPNPTMPANSESGSAQKAKLASLATK